MHSLPAPHTRAPHRPAHPRGPFLSLALLALLVLLPLLLTACSNEITLDCDQVRRICRGIHIGPTPTAAPLPPGEQAVPLRVVSGPLGIGGVVVLMQVSINGRGPYTFALDTGASQSLIDSQLAGQLGLPVVGRAPFIVGITGGAEANLVQVNQWQAGSVNLPSTRLVSLALPQANRSLGFQGLLGSDILSRFGSVTVDFANEQLILRPSP